MRRSTALIIIMFVMLVGCHASHPTSPSTIRLTLDQAGDTVTLCVGDVLEIMLAGNPTTGYLWESETVDPALVQQLGEPEFIPDSNLVGSGGMIMLRYKAIAPGQTRLKLIYHRPWETNVPPLQTFEVDLIVT